MSDTVTLTIDGREITYTPKQPAGDSRRAARAAGDLARPIGRHARAENPRTALATCSAAPWP